MFTLFLRKFVKLEAQGLFIAYKSNILLPKISLSVLGVGK